MKVIIPSLIEHKIQGEKTIDKSTYRSYRALMSGMKRNKCVQVDIDWKLLF